MLAGVHAHLGHARHGADGVQARLRQRAAQALAVQILRHHAPAQAGHRAAPVQRMAAAGDDASVAFDDQIRMCRIFQPGGKVRALGRVEKARRIAVEKSQAGIAVAGLVRTHCLHFLYLKKHEWQL
ncbi:hypothetical protein D3C81_1704340 [compost metagenome]